jgi:hypothetical protein
MRAIILVVALLILSWQSGDARSYYVCVPKAETLAEITKSGYEKNYSTKVRLLVSTYFNGYVAGVVDASVNQGLINIEGMSTEQVYAVVQVYLKNHPEKWNQDGFSVVQRALVDAFSINRKR